jgi:hypothetical protein
VRFLLATTNPAKVSALAERLGAGIEVAVVPDRSTTIELAEDLDSCAAIAEAKAVCFSRVHPGVPLIATDGGLTIPALGPAWHPVRTARFAGERSRGIDLALALLDRCAGLHGQDRRIGWTESLAVAQDGVRVAAWSAHSPPGLLATDLPADIDPASGFWIPWLWRCPECGDRRLSELTERERLERRDHWAILAEYLTNWVRNPAQAP